MIVIALYKEIYEVSKFVKKHPGEGIADTFLSTYNYKECTEDFERFHFTNEADDMLINAKENGFDEETGIYYVCPFFFKRKIPKYFYFLPEDKYGIEFMKDKENNTFILRPSNSDKKNSLSLTYKTDDSELCQLKIRKTEDDVWYTIWENEDGETEDIEDKTIEGVIKKVMLDNDYVGISPK